MKIHFSSAAFRGEDFAEIWQQCKDRVQQYGGESGIQLHNSESEAVVKRLSRNHIPLSVHAPLLQGRNWNLACPDAAAEKVLADIAENVNLLRSLGVTECVFHGGLMSDCSPEAFGHGKGYCECMQEVYREEFAIFPGKVYNNDFTACEEYIRRQGYLKKNLALLRERFEDILFCVENDFPAYGSMNMFFRDMVKLEHPLCLDTGHLWTSCHLLDRDFQEEVAFAASSGFVKMCHFHESVWKRAIPKDRWGDGHQDLSCRNEELDLRRVLRTLVQGGVEHFIFEFPRADAVDVEIFFDYLKDL